MNLAPYEASDLKDFLIAGKTWTEWCSHYTAADISARANAWISPSDLSRLQSAGGAATLELNGEIIASSRSGDGCSGGTVIASDDTFLIHYIWDLLKVMEQVVQNLPAPQNTSKEAASEAHPLAVINGTVKIGKGTKLLPGVYIEGNAVIGANCKIGPNCYIRGNTSIGDGCHIGNAVEVKNSLIGNKTNIGHLSYVGDSILGHGVNLGAGTIISNYRHDKQNHRSLIGETLIDTGRRKFGAILADGVHTGIHTSIYPGRKLGKGVTTLPTEVITTDKIN